MSRYVGANHPTVRRSNRAVIFRAIHELAPVARVDLARETGLNDKTVTNIVDELLREGLAREVGYRTVARAGRRAIELEVNHAARFAIGVDFTRQEVTAAITDLAGRVHARLTEPVPTPWHVEQVVTVAARLAAQLRQDAEPAVQERIVGIGIGVPNPLSVHDGHYRAFDSDTGAWVDLGSADVLRDEFGLPTIIDNHADTAALAELWFGNGKVVDNFVLVNLGPGVAASFVIDRHMFRGEHDSAGELTYMNLNASEREPASDGGPLPGSAQRYLGRAALLTQVRAALDAGETSSLHDVPSLGINDVIAAYQDGDPVATRVLDEAAWYIAAVIGNIVSVLDLRLILVGRELATVGEGLLNKIRDHVRQFVAPSVRESLRVEPTEVPDSPVVGAATLALSDFFLDPLNHPAAAD